jgi:hypothetical protein
MPTSVKWVAELANVREVSLFGEAELDFWKRRLTPEGLSPVAVNGRARVLIVSSEAKFWGLLFRELSFSVLVSPPPGAQGQEAAFLLCAYNSNRFFAFCERRFFSTPYHHGEVALSPSAPASVQMARNGELAFRAKMGTAGAGSIREPSRRDEYRWEGPVFLPARPGGPSGPPRLFFARIQGLTRSYPFIPDVDSLTFLPSAKDEVLQDLVDSGFVATEWAIRENAGHAKSKTYKRSKFFR